MKKIFMALSIMILLPMALKALDTDTFYVFEDTSSAYCRDMAVCQVHGGDFRCYENLNIAEYAALDATLYGDSAITILVEGPWANAQPAYAVSRGTPSSGYMSRDNWVHVIVEGDARHSGTWCDTCFRVMDTISGDYMVRIWETCFSYEGMQYYNFGSGYTLYFAHFAAEYDSGHVEIKNCLFRSNPDSVSETVANNEMLSYVAYINNVFYDWQGNGYWRYVLGASADTVLLYNNTFYGCDNAYGASGDLLGTTGDSTYFLNNLLIDCAASCEIMRYSPNAASGYNMTDKSGFGAYTPGATDSTDAVVEFADSASRNFMLISTDDAVDLGINASGLHGAPSYDTDIAGTSRGSSWCIGAFEYDTGGEEPGISVRRPRYLKLK